MELTTGQLRAARAGGCVLTRATDEQVGRLGMQRRIFRVDGLPFVAAHDGFFETWATLAALIGDHQPATAERGARTGAAAAPENGARGNAEPPPAPAVPERKAARAERNAGRTAGAGRREPGPPGPEPATATEGAAPTGGAAAEASEAEETLAGVAAAQGGGARARVVGRGRRAGQPPTPRWAVAGKMRRGRLK